MSLRKVAIGSAAMSSVTILRMFTQLFIVPVLARYLSPSDYGVVAVAMPFVLFAMMFSDAGMTASLIRTSSTERDEWSTSYWLTVLLGAGLAVVISLLGFIVALFLAEPILTPVIAALSLTVLLQSMATVPGASLQQSHKFTAVAGIEIASMFVSLGAAYFTAIHGGGVWALVAQQMAQFTTKLILTSLLAPFRPHLAFKLEKIRDHLIFGRDLIGNNFINFIRQSLGNMVTGKVLGTGPVGIISMAWMFSDIPNRLVSGPIQMVLYPHFSALKETPHEIRTLFLFLSRVIATLMVPLMGMLAVAHEPVFKLLLSEKWAQAGHVYMLLAPAACVMTVTALRFTIATALGKTGLLIRQSIETGILSFLFLICAVYFGTEWVAIASTLATLVYVPRSLRQILPLISLTIKDYMLATIQPLFTTAASIMAYLFVVQEFVLNEWEKFGVAIILGAIALGSSLLMQLNHLRNDGIKAQRIMHATSVAG